MITIRKNSREEIRIERVIFKNHELFHVQVWFENEVGEILPSRKEIFVPVNNLAKLKNAIVTFRDEGNADD